MIRGTTPMHVFTHSLDPSDFEKIRIIYSQDNTVLFVKTMEDCEVEGNTITVRLTQENTLAFDHNLPVDIQVRILTKDKVALASAVKTVRVSRCLENGVIV